MEGNAVTWAVLGLLSRRPMSGYDVKQAVDRTIRHFWAASYGQIYPELKNLDEAGLVKGSDASNGARPRTVYKLTAKGKSAANEWIERVPETYELRDEGLLALFFAGAIKPERAAEIARERAAQAAETAAQLRTVEEQIDAKGQQEGPENNPDAGSLAVLWYGIEMNEWVAAWFERAAEKLEQERSGAAGGR
jgi:DNA-binding PadR family transcriptional regulator